MTNLYMWAFYYCIWYVCEHGPRLLSRRLRRILAATAILFGLTALPSCRHSYEQTEVTTVIMMPPHKLAGKSGCDEGWVLSGQWCYQIRPVDRRASARPSPSPK